MFISILTRVLGLLSIIGGCFLIHNGLGFIVLGVVIIAIVEIAEE